uniref:NADH dehydrogenase subunit 2 n=1 Tax=Gastroclonium compressum TaxID=1852973 RepID=A0A173FZQ5_GASCM|nr:NADH dehydrogenase subunit 2 [Coeloseira compressa]
MINNLYNIYPLTTELYLYLNIFIFLLYGVFFSNAFKFGFPVLAINLGWLSLQSLILSFFLMYSHIIIKLTMWDRFLVSDLFSWYLKLLVLFSAIFWLFFSISYSQYEKLNSFEYWILILLAIGSMLILTQVYDLLSMYLVIELQSLIFYILASFKRNSEFSTEAGLKYFVLGAFSSALLLFGSSILYGFTGLTNFGDFSKFFSGFLIEFNTFFIGCFTGFIFILISFFFKLSVAPFHMWSPDVYEGSPSSVTAFLSTLPKIVILALTFRFIYFSFSDFLLIWRNMILFSVIGSLVIGSLGAFLQTKWKRFFAYSSITHLGFILIGFISGDFQSLLNVMFYFFVYLVTMLNIFTFILNFRIFYYSSHYQSRYLSEVSSLATFNPALALTLTFILFSMVGIPPLAGFFAKFFILMTTLQTYSFGLSLIAILVSGITCFYYIRLVKEMYFVKKQDWLFFFLINKQSSLILGLTIFLIIFLFFDLEFLILLISLSSSLLF